MKEYQFQYTTARDIALLFLACFLSTFIIVFVAIILNREFAINLSIPLIILSFIAPFLVFRIYKKRAVSNCTAKFNKDAVEFELKNGIIKSINFGDLVSYKLYSGKNGSILSLKNNVENFKIFANNNICDAEPFEDFCKEVVAQIERSKIQNKFHLIQEGSIFRKKGMLYFLVCMTSIYLLAFFIESNLLRIIIGIIGGFYFILMWTKYFIEKNKKID